MTPDEPLSAHLIQKIAGDLRKLRDLGAIDYYLPRIREGERYVVGFNNHIFNMNTKETMYFVVGTTAMAYAMARKMGTTL